MENIKYTFWEFLKEHKIEIPIIQRDFAQGRIGQEELRKSFLKDLKSALNSNSEVKLDFVYGTNENGSFNPLDGQQRLTTLWLIHWYIASSLGMLNDNGEPTATSNILLNFTYETRVSSRNFCKKLSVFNIWNEKLDVSQVIQNQTWFRASWKQDPTIDAMLRMLNSIEEIFKNCTLKEKDCWNKLTGEKCPIIFYYLDLPSLKQSDDLYIKMNARGEQLTSFENLKSDLIGYINKQAHNKMFDEKEKNKWNLLLDPKNGIPIKMDTIWTNIFWKNKSFDNRIDEIYFAFINRFFFNELFIAKNNIKNYILSTEQGKENSNLTYRYLNDSDNPNDYDTKVAYTGLEVYKYDNGEITLSFFNKLMSILDGYSKYINDANDIPICKWNPSFSFIPKYDDKRQEIENNTGIAIKKISSLNQSQRIVFFSLCKYFYEHELNNKNGYESLKPWIRVVWNLVSGEDDDGFPQIRSTPAMRSAIEFIDKLDSHDVYNSLAKIDLKEPKYAFDLRCNEEIKKAKQILTGNYDGKIQEYIGKTWEQVLIDAENFAFFHGSIRFLYNDSQGDVKWSDFDCKWGNAKKYFDENGVVKSYRSNTLLLRSLLSKIPKEKINEKLWFGNGNIFWHSELLNSDLCKYTSDILLGNTDIKANDDSNNTDNDWLNTNLLSSILNNNEKWHILSDWRGCKVLTKYIYRQSGTVNHPEEIVVLNHPIIRFGLNITNNKINGTNYFYGWDVIFNYQNRYFKWLVIDSEKSCLYLWNDNKHDFIKRPQSTKPTTDDNIYYRVEINHKSELLDCLEIKLKMIINEYLGVK